MAQEEDKSSLEEKFDAAVRVIRSLPENGVYQPSDDMMLMFFSYYKQATLGPCHIPRPTGFWDSRGKAKWDAWNSLGNMTKEEAMINYVEDIQLILETIPVSDEVSDLVEKLGNFYAEVDRGVEGEENEVDKRPFTRPFAKEAGFGDLWDDIQNPRGAAEEGNVLALAASGGDMEESRKNSEIERVQGCSHSVKSEDETNTEDEDDAEYEDEEDEEEKAHRSPDPRLLRVGGPRWRTDTRGSSSSVEPSMSSLTNGTHSSLNSEAEEEELACSREACVETHSDGHLNGHLCDYDNVTSEKHLRATDSDNEEFCDSMEHLAMEEGSSVSKVQLCGSRAGNVLSEMKTLYNERVEPTLPGNPVFEVEFSTAQANRSLSRRGVVSESPRVPCCSRLCVNIEAGRCCVSQSGHSASVAMGDVNKQIAMVLLKLHEDMASVLHRLHTLEVLTVSQPRSPSPKQKDHLSVLQKTVMVAFSLVSSLSGVDNGLASICPLASPSLFTLEEEESQVKSLGIV